MAQVMGLLCLTVLIPVFGGLSDRIGRRPLMLAASALYFVLPYPLFAWLQAEPGLMRLAVMQIVLCSSVAVGLGPISTALAEQFPARVRSTGLALGYNFAVMLFGGFAQLIVTWLIKATGTPLAPAYYVMFGAVAGFGAALFMAERHHEQVLH